MTNKTIAITMGDPWGIGPEIICKALVSPRIPKTHHYMIVGDLLVFQKQPLFRRIPAKVFSFIETSHGSRTTKHQGAGQSSFTALQTATTLIKAGKAKALVTAPLCKDHVRSAGFKFPGHTEYLCHEFDTKNFAMMFVAPQLRTVLSTIHVPLKKVPGLITMDTLVNKLMLTAESLRWYFGIRHPRMAVCGLNPHAGEKGLLGNEEKSVIAPAIQSFLKSSFGRNCTIDGPLPADGIFARLGSTRYDAILCHYHDQAMIPTKLLAPNAAVNLTLGLPFIRTSPAHGTAFDIAGKNKANPQSMIEAIKLAAQLM